jgi:hypothetical protein
VLICVFYLCFHNFLFSRLLSKFTLKLPSNIKIPKWGEELLGECLVVNPGKRATVNKLIEISLIIISLFLVCFYVFLNSERI